MKILSIVVLISLIVNSSCKTKEDEGQKYFNFIKDRVWTSIQGNRHVHEYYNSNDNNHYEWLALEIKDNVVYTPNSIAKGSPESDPMPNEYINNYAEGWYTFGGFEVVLDSLFIYLNKEDVFGESVYKKRMEIGNDTTIGIHDYNKLIIYEKINEPDEVIQFIWISKKS